MDFIIGTRLYAYPINGFDADKAAADERMVRRRAELSEKILCPSLRNQSDRDFSHYTIINAVAGLETASIYIGRLRDSGIHTTPVTMQEWRGILETRWRQASDGICVARIDDDDAVFSMAVEQAKMRYRKGLLTIYGWTTGLRCRVGEGIFRTEHVKYGKTGHHSILQTFIFDSSTPMFDPYAFDHSNVVTGLVARGMSREAALQTIANGDADADGPAFVYVRHQDSVSTRMRRPYDADSGFPPTSFDPKSITSLFGITDETQEMLLSGKI